MKKCTHCDEVRPIDQFDLKSHKSGYRRSHCKSCRAELSKGKGKTNYRKYWPHLSVKEARLEYEKLSNSQNHVCAICSQPDAIGKKLAVDHDHQSNKVRGLLCFGCNIAIGKLKDNAALVKKAWEYLACL